MRINVHGLLKETFYIVHCDERSRRRRDHDNRVIVACK
jgi:hypothetical protein